jgi:hypothetical protein
MSLKGWVLNKVNRLVTRVDLPPRATPLGQAIMRRAGEPRAPGVRANGNQDTLPRPQHLGAYAPLVAAMREELEHFVTSHVRMHLAIAEHDRYLLTSIEIECVAGDESRELLQRFMREFKPEQIKLYLAKEVIGRLPNASAIDLAHFGGLNAAPGDGADEAYGELLAELRRTEARAGQKPYQVSLKGRWSELAPAAGAEDKARGFDVPRTPLAGRTLEIEIDDATGRRHVTLPSVVPGRRYAVGNGDGCDIVVNGQYASRRHCEIWLDKGAWWVTDSGSTNGIRVESANSVLGRSGAKDGLSDGGRSVIEVVTGARIVLSALARGEPSQYPSLLLRTASELGAVVTPMAPPAQAPTTPATPIVAARPRDNAMILTVRMASGERAVELPAAPLPFRIGRSRNQALVIDWAHEDVSGHHVDIVELDEAGAKVAVHGDNGVTVAGVAHAPGAQFRWRPGETMVVGRAGDRQSECTLTLGRKP